MIRVGRIVNGKRPKYPGFRSVVVMMRSHSKWSDLSPYYLEDEKGRIFENVWQFSKVYPKVRKSKQFYSRWDKTIIWEHPTETHIRKGKITREYRRWRKKGMNNEYAVRYPVGHQYRGECVYSLAENEDGSLNPEQLDYVASRVKIYVKEYCRLVKKQPQFQELKRMLDSGKNILITEVDGPHQESLDYYRETYGVEEDFIEANTMLVTEENIQIMLNDTKYPFGHGYCLALALLGKDEEWNVDFAAEESEDYSEDSEENSEVSESSE